MLSSMQFSSSPYYVFRDILDEIKQGSIDVAVHRSMSDGELYICTMRYYVVRWVDDEESGGWSYRFGNALTYDVRHT